MIFNEVSFNVDKMLFDKPNNNVSNNYVSLWQMKFILQKMKNVVV